MNDSVRLNNNNESNASISVKDKPLQSRLWFLAFPNSGNESVYEPLIGFSSSCGNAYFIYESNPKLNIDLMDDMASLRNDKGNDTSLYL